MFKGSSQSKDNHSVSFLWQDLAVLADGPVKDALHDDNTHTVYIKYGVQRTVMTYRVWFSETGGRRKNATHRKRFQEYVEYLAGLAKQFHIKIEYAVAEGLDLPPILQVDHMLVSAPPHIPVTDVIETLLQQIAASKPVA